MIVGLTTEVVIQTLLNVCYVLNCFELAVLDQSWTLSGKSELLLCSIVYLIYKFSVQRTTCVQSRFDSLPVYLMVSSYILFPGLTPDLCITCESSKI
jgi:hypothetical protein